ncbi:MAG TPA: competence/damage-inducible protein A [Candidatus Tetragenococcus pullicola]|nr:competence/damage-inducible protein A [Candidatus Tetragenococcus pullicola]
MKAEIIAVGTEILLGQIVNTNATFLSEELASLGIDVYYQSVVGDNRERLENLVAVAEKRSDLIIICGGLGPTEDDLTKQVVAQHVGQTLVRDEAGYQNLLAFFKKRNRKMTTNNLLQTLVFKDGQALPNTTGLAVGIFFQDKLGTAYLLLPGPPNELNPMFVNEAIPLLKHNFPQEDFFVSRVLRFFGIGESQLVTELSDLIEKQTNPTIAPYAKTHEVTLRLTVKTRDKKIGIQQLDFLENQIQKRVGHYFYGYGDENSLAQVVVNLLKKQNKTVTAAESLTAGAFQATLGAISGVSEVFPGGFVTYSPETKASFLNIEPVFLEKYGTVSRECVEKMAGQAQKLAHTDFALAFSGVAGPDPLEGHSVGTVWIALADSEKIKSECYHFSRGRNDIRQNAVMTGLNMLRRELLS